MRNVNADVPTTLAGHVGRARAVVEHMRRGFDDQQDFEHMTKRALGELLEACGYSRQAIAYTMRVIFD
jgi:hypothetical protein